MAIDFEWYLINFKKDNKKENIKNSIRNGTRTHNP